MKTTNIIRENLGSLSFAVFVGLAVSFVFIKLPSCSGSQRPRAPTALEVCRGICGRFHQDLVGGTQDFDRYSCTCYSVTFDRFSTVTTDLPPLEEESNDE